MFENNENLVMEEVTENAEELTAEETVDDQPEVVKEEPEKKYTEEDFQAKMNEILARKIARERSKIRKEYEEEFAPYREAETVLNAGLKTTNITEATEKMREYYQGKGVEIPQYQAPRYPEEDLKVLAENEARKVIDSGLEDVIEEANRLAAKGVENMSPREKLVFKALAEYGEAEGRRKELLEIGVKDDVISSSEFQEFAKQFNQNVPITNVYKLYEKTTKQQQAEPIGSMRNANPGDEKPYFTPEEVDKLTEKDYDDPKIFQKVRESMSRWKN